MNLVEWMLEQPVVYRIWQQPFAERKVALIVQSGEMERARRILDVGCGPGTNVHHFEHGDYTGIDLNPHYVESARRRFKGRFIVGDASRLDIEGPFDFILANSLFHHLDDDATNRSLRDLHDLLSTDGQVHILDLVLPEERSAARVLARLDRGDYARPLEHWRGLFSKHFDPLQFQPYPLGLAGITLWQMVYFRGRRRQ